MRHKASMPKAIFSLPTAASHALRLDAHSMRPWAREQSIVVDGSSHLD